MIGDKRTIHVAVLFLWERHGSYVNEQSVDLALLSALMLDVCIVVFVFFSGDRAIFR